ncbi:hypothetical protein A3C32_02680 [Candidatus Daviesbacteria bacterium RIFCSPHIGHO2_02_FULL_41_14]|uniref:CxxC-x17-CxxC domain-containing protein n=1 Tax=Candidatus Daviesbacteria bacterium RIFCSPLOWO2_01_FULL_40_24 TaxID=1797787 RepID=A0A1F5MKF2_9BACT|nr:MAG: hypothetical protein A2780_01125 [Candidatus Daviesbacteria bacterium RIFCSPHIGHO2_01_FULL_41_45]OGE34617.1 MAG: hypothetical protein A3C32_02680 [Candidatus Daviesbacteria bacterium RIFCSPHIGHO2_02_FULL_41_14]OGE65854.1 MAG: hypothetical protein A3B49_03285 [Candidatus Daviesbacteria bacterium RIFCSPLOWO2_01_FULL_40_24]
MASYNRDNRSDRGRSFERGGFNDRGSRGPVQMHQAVCDKCRKDCEIPFRPTAGKPVFCSNCFDRNQGSDSRSFDRRSDSRPSGFDRPMFEAVCADCGNSCKVPFQPTGDKPVFCSNCFGEKKGAGNRDNNQPQVNEQLETLNSKLDQILQLLSPKVVSEKQVVVSEEVEVKVKPAKVKASKKSLVS